MLSTRMDSDKACLTTATEIRDARGYLRLAYRPMQTIGPAARTLAAIVELTDKRTHAVRCSLERISSTATLPKRTVQRHIDTLLQEEFITVEGTFGTTSTYTVEHGFPTPRKYLALPRWWNDPRWAPTATYSWLLSRACLVEHIELEGGCASGRLMITQAEIARDTWLSGRSVRRGLSDLRELGFIDAGQPTGLDHWFEFELRTVVIATTLP